MLQNALFLAKVGADTAESDQHCAKFCQHSVTWGSDPPAEAREARIVVRPRGRTTTPAAPSPGSRPAEGEVVLAAKVHFSHRAHRC